ncbi:hypothetical protein [Massilia timonae]|nr:hypothetical protein [Massilia timonae]HAK90784.1 hypothetical protein [Massilia timonae]
MDRTALPIPGALALAAPSIAASACLPGPPAPSTISPRLGADGRRPAGAYQPGFHDGANLALVQAEAVDAA